MKLTLLLLAVLQSLLLCTAQVLLKTAMTKIGTLSLTFSCIRELFTNLWLLTSGLCFIATGILWTYIIKHFPLSQAYPLVSLAYVFAMFAAVIFFHEHIVWHQWIGVFLIISGCACIVS